MAISSTDLPTCSVVSTGPEDLHEGIDIDTLPLGVGRDGLGAQVGGRRQPRQHGHEADPQPGPLRFDGGIAGDEPDGGLRPGVTAAQR